MLGKQWWVISLHVHVTHLLPLYPVLDGPSESPSRGCSRASLSEEAAEHAGPQLLVPSGLHSWSTKQSCSLVAVQCMDQAGFVKFREADDLQMAYFLLDKAKEFTSYSHHPYCSNVSNFYCQNIYSKDWYKTNNLGAQREADFSPPPHHSWHGAVQACYLPM